MNTPLLPADLPPTASWHDPMVLVTLLVAVATLTGPIIAAIIERSRR